ncbi:uncharacterized protein KIAA1958-like [Dendronephthya gigantea]|uniref:uncharacterized protein KIAA1958-like n=1 Tax=Dendronephthya gigantea TaxID=151771 RepID=UPI00106A09E3|nr:uncharacterized protein KIAA1958-like [Dendronephthya gigantea]
MAEKRFVSQSCSAEKFILDQENKSTWQKTRRDVHLLESFLRTKSEERKIEQIPATVLNKYLSEFIMSVRKKDGKEFEPTSLRSLVTSFERHLKSKSYPSSIINDLVFEQTMKVLRSKQKMLKKQGEGNKPNASVALTNEEIQIIYERKLLGIESPEALLNTLWLNNCLHFGLRGCKEHRDMCWGDVKLHKTAQGQEYLEFNERQTKTRTGSDYRDVRTVPPKMFATDRSEKDPVAVYKFFSQKRPQEMNYDDAPFYLSVNNFKATDSAETKAWFKPVAVGVNKLNSLVKRMAANAGIENSRLRNHSGRKTMVHRLSESDVPPTQHHATWLAHVAACCHHIRPDWSNRTNLRHL